MRQERAIKELAMLAFNKDSGFGDFNLNEIEIKTILIYIVSW
jgi:hypothetical protein